MINVKPKVAIEATEKEKKQQEEKKLLTGRYRRGLKLFGFDPDKMEVYQVEIKTRKDFVISKGEQSSRKANINPNHLHLWALNMDNAVRKFEKQLRKRMERHQNALQKPKL